MNKMIQRRPMPPLLIFSPYGNYNVINKKLNFDVMTQIFLFTLDEIPDNDLKRVSKHRLLWPNTLGAVCKSWQWITRRIPRLWTNVVASLDVPDRQANVAQLRAWIARSGSLPLNVLVVTKDLSLDIDRKTAHETPSSPISYYHIVKIISECSERWQNLDIEIPMAFAMYMFRLAPRIPLIDTLRLQPTNWFDNYLESKLFPAAIPFPRRVFMGHVVLASCNLDWTRVTHFEGKKLTLGDSIGLLNQAPMLESFQLKAFVDWMDPSPAQPTVHHNLRRLSFDPMSGSEEHDDFISLVTLPKLKHLEIDISYRQQIEWVLGLIERSSCSLSTLKITFGDIPYEYLKRLLGASTSIKHFYLSLQCHLGMRDDYDKMATLFQDLSGRIRVPEDDDGSPILYDIPPLLPLLETIEFRVQAFFPWDDALELFEIALHYELGCPNLRSLKVSYLGPWEKRPRYGFMSPDCSYRVRNLRRRGCDIQYKYEQYGLQHVQRSV